MVLLPWLNSRGAAQQTSTSDSWGKYLCYAMLAISVDLLWGYTGLLSLGQALFFSLGGYMLGMHLMLMIGKLGQVGQNPNLIPDFMVSSGYTVLPWFWRPFASFAFAVLMVFLLPGLLSGLFGWLAFRSRIKGVYFSILTQALTYAARSSSSATHWSWAATTGSPISNSSWARTSALPARSAVYSSPPRSRCCSIYIGCRWLTGTKFGLIQRAIRDSENRVLFSGYPVARFKLFIFVVSGVIAASAARFTCRRCGSSIPAK